MIGETGIGLYVAYAFIVAFLLLLLVMFLRVAALASILWFSPLATLLRRVPGVRRLLPRERDRRSNEQGRQA